MLGVALCGTTACGPAEDPAGDTSAVVSSSDGEIGVDSSGGDEDGAPADECAEWIAEAPACPAVGTDTFTSWVSLGGPPDWGESGETSIDSSCSVAWVMADEPWTQIGLECPEEYSIMVTTDPFVAVPIDVGDELELELRAIPNGEGTDWISGYILRDADGIVLAGTGAATDLSLDFSPFAISGEMLDCYWQPDEDDTCGYLMGTMTATLGDESVELTAGNSANLGGYLVAGGMGDIACNCVGNFDDGPNLRVFIVRQ